MPQRFLRPGITTSKRYNRCDWFSQTFYVRLITLVDDYGRHEADAELLCAHAFPFGDPQRKMVEPEEIEKSLTVLESAGLLQTYVVDDKRYLQLTRWQERARSTSRCPAPIEEKNRGEPIGKVYFIQAVKSGNIKIGFTITDLNFRLSTLQTGCPEKLVILHWIKGTKQTEFDLHERLKSERLDGEWFKNSEAVRECIFALDREHVLSGANMCTVPSIRADRSIDPRHRSEPSPSPSPASIASDPSHNARNGVEDIEPEGRSNGDWHSLTLLQKVHRTLGATEMILNDQRWQRRAHSQPGRLTEIIDKMNADIREGKVIKNRGAYAEELWNQTR